MREDDAIDVERSDYGAYWHSRFTDHSHLVFREGYTPTVFTIRALDYPQRHLVADMNGAALIETYVRAGLIGVKGYVLQREDGSEEDAPPVEHVKESGFGDMVTRKWLATVNMLHEQMVELWRAIDIITEAERPKS
jgi:hypothetical protein